MAYYEVVYLTRQDLSTNQINDINEKITTLVEKFSGKVAKTEYWGLKNLAYKIKKNKKAHYCFLNIEISAVGLRELNRIVALNEKILRHLIIKVDKLDDKPSIMMLSSNKQETKE